MRFIVSLCAVTALVVAFAGVANADAQPSARDIQAAVDSYLATSDQDANLVGGPGTAGYDAGFWIRGGDFLLRINLTLQARFEAFDFDETQPPEAQSPSQYGGDLSGFSLPRATLKFSGEAPCNICYYVELEFGHWGRNVTDQLGGMKALDNLDRLEGPGFGNFGGDLGGTRQSLNFDNTREAWIEWCYCPAFNLRMGQIMTPSTRQLMVAPEFQQFVDISLATAFTDQLMAGYTDRNRDHGFMLHGVFGCNDEWSYILTVTNGDGGDSIRNVIDHRTSDNLAYALRINWAFLNKIGYQEGALRQQTCQWYGELGGWVYYYADRSDKQHTAYSDSIRYGADLALGYGGWSFTAAFTGGQEDDTVALKATYTAWLAQLGYHFVGTAWEIAARVDSYEVDNADGFFFGPLTAAATIEYAFALNYYLNGHANKLQLDVSIIEGSDPDSFLIFDPYAGYPNSAGGEESFGILFRFQWQLAL